jgi:dolichyl-phosphate beta-glucosyltransferase
MSEMSAAGNTRSSPLVSIVIPAYNEEARLSATLETVSGFLEREYSRTEWEILICDDGSTDRTTEVIQDVVEAEANVLLQRLPHRGKGATVRAGVLRARGRFILFSDADLATPITEARRLFQALQDGADVAIGSRAADGAQRLNEPFYREAMGRVFHSAVHLLLLRQFADTQCGFKAFRRCAAKEIFERLVLYNDDSPVLTRPAVTGFDLEVLFLATRLGYRIEEVPVEWHYRKGSKVNPLRDSIALFQDVIRVRMNDRRGVYDVPRQTELALQRDEAIDGLKELKDETHVA